MIDYHYQSYPIRYVNNITLPNLHTMEYNYEPQPVAFNVEETAAEQTAVEQINNEEANNGANEPTVEIPVAPEPPKIAPPRPPRRPANIAAALVELADGDGDVDPAIFNEENFSRIQELYRSQQGGEKLEGEEPAPPAQDAPAPAEPAVPIAPPVPAAAETNDSPVPPVVCIGLVLTPLSGDDHNDDATATCDGCGCKHPDTESNIADDNGLGENNEDGSNEDESSSDDDSDEDDEYYTQSESETSSQSGGKTTTNVAVKVEKSVSYDLPTTIKDPIVIELLSRHGFALTETTKTTRIGDLRKSKRVVKITRE